MGKSIFSLRPAPVILLSSTAGDLIVDPVVPSIGQRINKWPERGTLVEGNELGFQQQSERILNLEIASISNPPISLKRSALVDLHGDAKHQLKVALHGAHLTQSATVA